MVRPPDVKGLRLRAGGPEEPEIDRRSIMMQSKTKQNSSHWESFCKGCVKLEQQLLQNAGTYDSADWQAEGQSFLDACARAGVVRVSTSRVHREKSAKWAKTTLAVLFGGAPKPVRKFTPDDIDKEAEMMEALADAEEDARLDDGAIECSDDEYVP
ncbi:hypothetical protein K438DRAFT_1764962 [Mycena galopus ATCC 62051]|nr:hypothetical protein K438DRAFT_1764962 [Mycena galopus ATCC 62051]